MVKMMSFAVESWVWYGVAMSMVILRFTARILHFKSPLRLQIEDWLMLFIAFLYTILIEFLNIDTVVQTNLINPADIPHLTAQDIKNRTWGSKTILLVEQCMCAVQWGTKCCLLILYWRLTQNLRQNIMVKVTAVYVGVTYIVMEIFYFGVWCRPFHDYWQTPTDNTQCTTALHHLIMNMAFNLSSDLLIMSIPLPLFLKAHLELKRKVLLIFPFTLGIFTIICAILSKHLSFTQPFSGDWVYWYCRESSTAMIVTNMPYSWSLIRRIFKLKSFFGESGDEGARGSVVSLQGVSMREASAVSTAAIRTKSRSDRLFSMVKEKKSTSAESESRMKSNTWGHDDRVLSGNNKSTIDTAGEMSSSGGSSVARMQRTTDNTVATLDKLYPLEDFDLEEGDEGDLADPTARSPA